MTAFIILIIFALTVYFFSARIAPGLLGGIAIATVVLNETSYIQNFIKTFGTEEVRGYVTIALFLLITIVFAFISQGYNSGRKFHGQIGRVIFASIFGFIFGLLSIVILRDILNVKEILTLQGYIETYIKIPNLLLILFGVSLITLYFGKGR